MCGRYNLSAASQAKLAARFAASGNAPHLDEVFPTNDVPVVIPTDDGRRIEAMHWGFIPFWAKDEKPRAMINARAEGIETKPMFREAVRHHRCLVPADAFYEWQSIPGEKKKQRIRYTLKDEELFAMAGIWSAWRQPDGAILHTVAHITCPPNALVEPVHDRMPVILTPDHEAAWLDPELDMSDLPAILTAYPAAQMFSEVVDF